MKSNVRTIVSGVIKATIGVAAISYVVWKTWEDRETLLRTWEELDGTGIGLLILTLFLVIPNLWLEALKWRRMIKPHYPDVTQRLAIKAILAGMASGIFTPNRIGEYAGRVLYLDAGRRIEAIVGTFVDRITQLAVTLLTGMFVLLGKPSDHVYFGPEIEQGLVVIAAISLSLILVLLAFPRTFSQLIPGFLLRFAWVRQVKEAASQMERSQVIQVFGLSLLRYAVFSTQYVLLLYALGWPVDVWTAYRLVALVFLAKSVVPVPGIMELGVRETIALQVFAVVLLPPASAVQSTFLLYVINIILPTLAGVATLRGIRLWDKAKEAQQ